MDIERVCVGKDKKSGRCISINERATCFQPLINTIRIRSLLSATCYPCSEFSRSKYVYLSIDYSAT